MIVDAGRRTVLSSLGWVDHDALWRLDVASGRVDAIPLGTGARHASLHPGEGDRFAVAHHFDGRRLELSVRPFAAPEVVLARAVLEDGRAELGGDPDAWAGLPWLYVAYLAWAPWRDFVLVRLAPPAGIELQRLPWYDASYDKGYQGVVDVLEVPGTGCALVSVQRSSTLILHDLATGERRRAIPLAGRGGNPRLALRGAEVWASDYDTLVVLRTADWRIRRRARLQGAASGSQQFIGDFAVEPDGALCLVARPFGGDVVAVDLERLRVRSSARVGGQPLEVAALGQGEVVARDWKTGALLRGRLGRRGIGWAWRGRPGG
jgi:hypothetical protein